MIPKDVYEVFNSDTGTMMALFFDEGTSSDGTMEAIGRSVNWQENSAF